MDTRFSDLLNSHVRLGSYFLRVDPIARGPAAAAGALVASSLAHTEAPEVDCPMGLQQNYPQMHAEVTGHSSSTRAVSQFTERHLSWDSWLEIHDLGLHGAIRQQVEI